MGDFRLRALLDTETFPHRTALAAYVCADFRFHDARGNPQPVTCLKALRTLHAGDSIALPPPVRHGGHSRPRRLGHPVEVPRSVPASRRRLELVTDDRSRRTELIAREHPPRHCLPANFRQRYGDEPLLAETLVDRRRHAGTSFKAANWIHVGRTAGRGRCAPTGASSAALRWEMYAGAAAWCNARPPWPTRRGPRSSPQPGPTAP